MIVLGFKHDVDICFDFVADFFSAAVAYKGLNLSILLGV